MRHIVLVGLMGTGKTTVARLASDLEVLRQQGFRLAVIDTPPAITMAIQSVIAVAELIVTDGETEPIAFARGLGRLAFSQFGERGFAQQGLAAELAFAEEQLRELADIGRGRK